MNVNFLIRRLRGGFRPFVLRVTDGRAFNVPHPEFIAVGPRAVIVFNKQGDPVYIDPLHVVSIDDKKASRKNGKGH